LNNLPYIELNYSKIILRVIREHLEENSCNHSILQIAAEADREASKTAIVGKQMGLSPTNSDQNQARAVTTVKLANDR
jgi:hypothetical protein